MMESVSRHVYRLLILLVLLTIATGTIVYHLVEKFSWLNSYYFSVITLATVGYGDLTPHTNFGKLFTTFYIFVGVGIITTFISLSMRRRAARMQERHDNRNKKK
ncbi:MAG TPA: potassium channel family protein [Patescibacteria group bacterium]|nr:potassium channel family protein [Patescibacteria group bacterium]